MIYSLNPSANFTRRFKKIASRNSRIKEEITNTMDILVSNPFSSILQTHKVQASVGGIKRSSRVNGDIRIIWDFNGRDIRVIDLWDLGSHSGSKKVYK